MHRKVRGILNKLTPEKFQKLSDDLLALELDSDKVLKGVILLIFEKALDEPKYSSMYAQLCKRLSEEAPNWEPPDQPCTFRRLLLNKCRTEFENRASAFEALDGERLSSEDEEKRHIAKSKMLGNIKLIGELGKLEILSESIVHRCIQQLLPRRSAGTEHHEDLECLAQLARTCGRVLDSERGRPLVDQYFARIETLSTNRELAPRIRFMLRDLAELRRNGWVPRAAITTEGPVPIQQLGGDDDPPPRREPAQPDPLFRHGLRTRSGLDDVLSGLSLSSNNLVPPPNSDKFGFGSNGFGGRDYRHRNQGGYGYNQRNQSFNKHHHNSSNNNSKETAPRFNKGRILATPGAVEELRPAANSLLFTANKLIKPHTTSLPLTNTSNVLTPTFASTPLMKESSITIKPAADKHSKPKKDKGLNKEEILKTVSEICSEACAECGTPNEDEVISDEEPKKLSPYLERLRALQLNDKMLRQVCNSLLQRALLPESSVWVCVWLVRGVKRGSLVDSVKALVGTQHARLPSLLAHCILQKLCTLKDVGGWLEGEQGSPVLLQVLQELLLLAGRDTLTKMYNDSKLEMAASVTKFSLAEAVEARGLGFLMPQLRVQAELARQLGREPSVQGLYRWIKANVDLTLRHSPAFVSALFCLILKYIIQEAGTECASPDKAGLEKEKALVAQYAPLLTAALDGKPQLQLAAVYAVQVCAHNYNYPKGMLLRWFMYLYNLEVCEEDAFLRWREDITDVYPGKGEALFQVNAWLTWLQQQESEDEEADD